MQLQLNMRSMEPLGGSGGMPPPGNLKLHVIGLNLVTILCYNEGLKLYSHVCS